MIKNFFKVGWRRIVREPLYSGINIIGLSIGIATAVLLLLFATNEWSYEEFHEKGDRIYRVWVKEFVDGHVHFNTVSPIVIGEELKQNFPQVEKVARLINANHLIKVGEVLSDEVIYYAGTDFFNLFDFEILHGIPNLTDPVSLIISEAEALRLYGHVNVVGQTAQVQIGGEWQEKSIVAVMKDVPANSSLVLDYLLSYNLYNQGLSDGARTCYTCVFGETYVMLEENITKDDLLQVTQPFFDEKVSDIYEAGDYQVGFQALRDIHLESEFPIGIATTGDARYPFIMVAIAFLILLLACINYVNLAVARSLNRMKEVGVRKVVGAKRSHVAMQHMGEALLVTTVATLFGLVIAQVALPAFNSIFDQRLAIDPTPSRIALGIFFLFLLAGISAAYPAGILARYRPIQVLSGVNRNSQSGRPAILQTLVGFQFFLSIVLITGSLLINKQLSFMTERNLGFKHSANMVVTSSGGSSFSQMIGDSRAAAQRMRQSLSGNAVQAVSTSNHALGSGGWMRLGFREEATETFRNFRCNGIEPDFLTSYDLEVIDGQSLSQNQDENQNRVLVNETFIREFELSDPVGAPLPKPFNEFIISGIVKDFHYESLREKIEPLVLIDNPLPLVRTAPDMMTFDSPVPKFTFTLDGSNIIEGVKEVERIWSTHQPTMPFDYAFVEDDLQQMYSSESRASRIVRGATGLALAIAGIGLFGIAGISISRRRKELGIRKILGARGGQLVGLLSKEFLVLVVIAMIFAVPTAAWLGKKWLADFAYQVPINWSIYLMSGGLLLLVSAVAVASHAFKIIQLNPVNTIRDN